ncbi:hypothetical protein CHUAL_011797 [Chamberlinius hualienensis]
MYYNGDDNLACEDVPTNAEWCGRSSPLMESSSPSPSSSGQGEPSSGQASTSKSKSPNQSKKICGVCGDRAKSYHFGGISCDSCKAFFRRSVQNDAHKNFQCSYDYDCEINITSRKCCQYCRFQKCLRIGMEKSWVMTEEERMQILRQRMERRASRQLERERATTAAATVPKRLASDEEAVPLTEDETETIGDIVQRYAYSFQQVPYSPELSSSNDNRSIVEIVSMISTTIRRMTHFAGHLELFAQLSQSDQASLLRGGMVELCLIRAVYAYDDVNNCWPNINIPLYRDCPILKASDLQRIVSPELHEMHTRFNDSMREMNLDENAIMLFLMVALFTPDRPGLEAEAQISAIQERYLGILKKYITWKYSPEVSSKLYPKILLKLPDLRQLNDSHTESQLRLMEEEVTEIQRHVVGEILCSEERRFGNGQQAGPSHADIPVSAKRPRLLEEAAQATVTTTKSNDEDMPSTLRQSPQQHSVVSVIRESVSRSREESQRQRSSSESSSST